MRKATRSERIKDFRKRRFERANRNIEAGGSSNTRMSRGNKLTLLIILMFSAFSVIIFSRNLTPTFNFSKEKFIESYEQFIYENKDKFVYDKNIKDIVQDGNVFSYVQYSTDTSKNMVSLYEQNNKVKRVAVLGKIHKSDDFEVSYRENIILIMAVTTNSTYEDSRNLLKKIGILDDNYNIIYRDKIFKVKFDNIEVIFFNKNNNLIFNLEN